MVKETMVKEIMVEETMVKETMIHHTAEVSPRAKIGNNVRLWHQAQIREGAVVGDNCIVAKNVYIDKGVIVGANCKIQNNCSLYRGTTIEPGVFIGPHCIFTNDKYPRAVTGDGTLKSENEWKASTILVKKGASLGARTVVLPGVTIGIFAMVGAGSVVTKEVPDYGLVYGNPARLQGYVCPCGRKLGPGQLPGENCSPCAEKG